MFKNRNTAQSVERTLHVIEAEIITIKSLAATVELLSEAKSKDSEDDARLSAIYTITALMSGHISAVYKSLSAAQNNTRCVEGGIC